MAMPNTLIHSESHVLQAGENFALVALLTPALPHSVLVQLVGAPLAGLRIFSLYTVYREDSMTFDAIVRFDPGADATLPKADLLQRFVAGPTFETAVLAPLARTVRRHFDTLHR